MKKTLSILLAAVILAAACIAPAGAQPVFARNAVGRFRPESVAAYDAARKAAEFVYSYESENMKYHWIGWAIDYLASEYPDCISYEDAEQMHPVATVGAELVAEAFFDFFPNAPANFFDTVVTGDLAAYYDASSEKYSLKYPDAVGSFEGYDYAGLDRVDDTFYVYFSLIEKVALDPSLVTDPELNEIEYDGKMYVWDPIECEYVWHGGVLSWRTIELKLTDDGLMLISQTVSTEGPAQIKEFPVPDGDVNGDLKVNAKDVTAIMKYLVDCPPAAFSVYAADFKHDGFVNSRDVITVMKAIVGIGEGVG